MTRTKWTPSALATEAFKYNTRYEFKKGNATAYAKACKLKILDAVCSHMESGLKQISDNEVLRRAKQYNTKTEFALKDGWAYKLAKTRGLDSAFDHMEVLVTTWTRNRIMTAVSKCSSRVEFQTLYHGAYQAALRLGIYEEIQEMLKTKLRTLAIDTVREAASNFKYRIDFKREDNSAYKWACENGVLDEVCSHMEFKKLSSDNNCVYIWKALDIEDVYKIGVTSARLGEGRIKECAMNSQLNYEVVIMVNREDALDIEAKALTLGTKYEFDNKFDGYTEFRKLDMFELAEAIKLLQVG